jgi:hypothetical protein
MRWSEIPVPGGLEHVGDGESGWEREPRRRATGRGAREALFRLATPACTVRPDGGMMARRSCNLTAGFPGALLANIEEVRPCGLQTSGPLPARVR